MYSHWILQTFHTWAFLSSVVSITFGGWPVGMYEMRKLLADTMTERGSLDLRGDEELARVQGHLGW